MPTLNPNVASQQSRWHVFSNLEELEEQAVRLIVTAARAAIAERGAFHVVLAGGTTPTFVYARLRAESLQWDRWHVYFGDERCLPVEDKERNSLMACKALLQHVPIPPAQIYKIPAELGPDKAAAAYARLLKGVPAFDLVLLGLGEDGHTASLFPRHPWETASELPEVIAVRDAPKPPPERVSLSPQRLGAARQVLFLVGGAGKAQAVRAWRAGDPIPASRIIAPAILVYVDAAAHGEA